MFWKGRQKERRSFKAVWMVRMKAQGERMSCAYSGGIIRKPFCLEK